mmetsp:Transcript_25896/g.65048  ORF Transcript_25896/g.65048 Transcript_25896/m.65048 type:complete len:258 (+) Transcript_25896:909-1682(+)
MWYTVEAELKVGNVHLDGQRVTAVLAELLVAAVESLSQTPLTFLLLRLVGVPVRGGLVVEVARHLHHLVVELHVLRALLADQDRRHQVEVDQHQEALLGRLEEGVSDVVAQDVHGLSLHRREAEAVRVRLQRAGALAAADRRANHHAGETWIFTAILGQHQLVLLDEALRLLAQQFTFAHTFAQIGHLLQHVVEVVFVTALVGGFAQEDSVAVGLHRLLHHRELLLRTSGRGAALHVCRCDKVETQLAQLWVFGDRL